MKNRIIIKVSAGVLGLSAALLLLPKISLGAEEKPAAEKQSIKGEVVDLMCYLDHGAKGEKHKGCASKCIKGGGPIGLLTADDQLYLVTGDHKPLNDVLADKAAQTVTLKGKVVERNGVKMITDAELEM